MQESYKNSIGLFLVLLAVAACFSCGKFGFPYDDCVPDCTSRVCGQDGCGGLCLPGCDVGETCDETRGQCEGCTADCEGRACGPDGCGGSCLPGCDVGEICNETMGQCERCIANCDGRECGLNECGISCGDCSVDASCSDGICVCDFVDCDGICCVSGEVCYAGSCCNADCTGRDCGADGCGGTCGAGCGQDETCNEISGQCESVANGEFLTIDPGTFEMGTPEGGSARKAGGSDEILHTVTLTRRFAMLSTEVPQGQFESLMGYNPSYNLSCGVNCPVESLNWSEAAAYCNALSVAEGFATCYTCTGTGADVDCAPDVAYASPYDCPGYRLPTEAEWEYAARAGTAFATYNGNQDDEHLGCEQPNDVMDSIAWFCGNSGDRIHPVGMKTPNDYDLYDMLGNVHEWCHDRYGSYPAGPVDDPWGPTSGLYRVYRGGAWYAAAEYTRAAVRLWNLPEHRDVDLGFRPVRSLAGMDRR